MVEARRRPGLWYVGAAAARLAGPAALARDARWTTGASMATATAHHYATVNPYTGEVVREFDSLDAAAVDRAVEAAHQAFGTWRDRSIEERAAIVHRAGELLAERRDRLAGL